ncbi:hypothetical protein NC652_002701 [Populus alba x Populus x berolinensis]|nr:hypothetical protein NC652_002701 [Populus alba x Populus x berolinensis]
MSTGAGKIVCVTGASGYIASWIVKLLLSRGYTVKASVRDPNDPKKTQHLRALSGAQERLELVKANLLEEGSFDSIVEGCEGVFHTASPFYHDVKDPQAELLDPAVKGTLNVLGSCAKHPSIKRVVLTSSTAAVVFNGKPRTPDVVVDETWFSDPELCRESKFTFIHFNSVLKLSVLWDTVLLIEPDGGGGTTTLLAILSFYARYMKTLFEDEVFLNGIKNLSFITSAIDFKTLTLWYVLSKTLAEDAAWKFAKEKGMDMVAINPSMVIGPLLQPTLNTSAAAILSLIKGAQTFSNASFGWINVKDVANAHIQAFELSSASGRYCLVERVAHHSEVVKILRELYPDLQLPEKCADDKPYVPIYQVSKEKAKSLGIEFIPLEASIKETVESLKEKGFVSF